MNIGAEKPDDWGNNFAWGETEPKAYGDVSNYKYGTVVSEFLESLTKYNTDESYGIVDNKTTLDLSDDAAYVNWGGNWRIPTFKQMEELAKNCTIKEDPHGDYIKLVSKINQKSILWSRGGTYLSEIDIYFPTSAKYCSSDLDYQLSMSREYPTTIRPVCTV
jgi:hypothetical protein